MNLLLSSGADRVGDPAGREFSQRIKSRADVIFLPHFISWGVIVTLFTQVFGAAGIVNHTLQSHGSRRWTSSANPAAFNWCWCPGDLEGRRLGLRPSFSRPVR